MTKPVDQFSRIPAKAGWCDTTKLPRGPNGRAHCRQCGAEVPKGSRSFCSNACIHLWKLTTDPAYQRQHVHKRDRGVCAMCRLDTDQLERDFREARRASYRERYPDRDPPHHTSDYWLYSNREGPTALLKRLGFLAGRSFWEMDHIVPVVEGGGGCTLANLRTLCRPCHLEVTRALRARRAKNPKIRRRAMP